LALALLLIVGRAHGRAARVGAAPDVATIDLNRISDAKPLDAVLQPVFDNLSDRQLAARSIFAALAGANGTRRTLANVGAIARLRVPAAEVDQESSRASRLSARLDEEGRRAAAAPPPGGPGAP